MHEDSDDSTDTVVKEEYTDVLDVSQTYEHNVPGPSGQTVITQHAETSIIPEIEVEEPQIPDQGAAGFGPPDPEEDYSFLHYFTYDQHRRPKRNDIVFYFDGDLNDWAEVRILSKTKYPNNYNIRFLNTQRRDENIYFNPGDFWSLGQPQPRVLPKTEIVQEFVIFFHSP